MKRAVVIAGGSIENYGLMSREISADDYIICADSGIVHCEKMGFAANLIVGDFDSCDYDKIIKSPSACRARTERLIPEKEDTDAEHALMCAYRLGFDKVLLMGALGTRADHALSNIFMLEKLHSLGVSAEIINENNRIRFLKNEKITVSKDRYKYVSIVPLSAEAKGVSCCGFKYPLCNESLRRFSSRGVSNELLDESGTIEVCDGSVLVIQSRD